MQLTQDPLRKTNPRRFVPPSYLQWVALLAGVCQAGAASGDDVSWARAVSALSSSAIRSHVEFLSDPLLEGRRAGFRGEQIAAKYIAAQLVAYGIPFTLRPVPLRLVTIKKGSLVATHGNVSVTLEPGRDFVLLSAPTKKRLSLANPALERLTLDAWQRTASWRGLVLVTGLADAALRVAISPQASDQIQGASTRLDLALDQTTAVATDILVQVAGRQSCVLDLDAHHDGLGPEFLGAADAAGAALLLEVVRGIALVRDKPRCKINLTFFGAAETGLGKHSDPPVGPVLAERAHTQNDRIRLDWDWEALKSQAQTQLVRVGTSDR